MVIKEYLKYLSQGLYSIGEAFSFTGLDGFEKGYELFKKPEENNEFEKEWERICSQLGRDLESLVSIKNL